MIKTLCTILFVFLVIYSTAQKTITPYLAIDKRAKTIQATSIKELAIKLCSPYKTETEKVMSIFKWITENIAYDVEGYHSVESIYEGFWQPELYIEDSIITSKYNESIIKKVLKEKRAICDGYSRLFKTLCDEAKIRCEIVSGLIRWQSDPIGVATNRRHAWNAVFIKNEWKLIDATWASGYSNHEVTKFTKLYDDFFFFPSPMEFFNDHYPDDKKWSLLPRTPSLDQFYNFPFYYPTFFSSGIISLKPTSGFIELSSWKKPVRIEIETTKPVNDIYIYEEVIEKSKEDTLNSVTYETETEFKPDCKVYNGRITCTYQLKSEKASKINVMLNDKLIISYGIKIIRQLSPSQLE